MVQIAVSPIKFHNYRFIKEPSCCNNVLLRPSGVLNVLNCHHPVPCAVVAWSHVSRLRPKCVCVVLCVVLCCVVCCACVVRVVVCGGVSCVVVLLCCVVLCCVVLWQCPNCDFRHKYYESYGIWIEYNKQFEKLLIYLHE